MCLLSSCSNQEERIKLLEKELNIELGNGYEIIKDDDASHGAFDSDYTLIVQVKLEKFDLDKIVKKIKSEPYFNQLGRFKNKYGGITMIGEHDIRFFKNAKDSLKNTEYRGSWFETEKGYEFIDLGEILEPVYAEIDSKESSLLFQFSHL